MLRAAVTAVRGVSVKPIHPLSGAYLCRCSSSKTFPPKLKCNERSSNYSGLRELRQRLSTFGVGVISTGPMQTHCVG